MKSKVESIVVVDIHIGRYCVYTHSDGEGRVFYVGRGVGARAFDMASRNPTWREIVRAEGRVMVSVMGWYESGAEAIEAERYLIKMFRPKANIETGRQARGRSLVDRGAAGRVPSILNVARITRYGRVDDWDEFRARLRKRLKVSDGDTAWEVPEEWAGVWAEYFFMPDPVYQAYMKREAENPRLSPSPYPEHFERNMAREREMDEARAMAEAEARANASAGADTLDCGDIKIPGIDG